MEKLKICSHRKNISSNHLFSDFFSKNVVFTRFLQKMRESEFVELPHWWEFCDTVVHSVVIHEFLSHDFLRKFQNFFVQPLKQRFSLVKMVKIELQNCNFREFRAKLRRS